MKGLLYLTLSVLITAGTAAPAWAQFALTAPEIPVHSQAWQPSMDSDLRQIRLNAFPELRFRADDYIRCTPAAVLLLTKAFGYEGRSSWGRMLAADAFSIAFMAASVNGFKYTVCRMRPDGSARNSFPSGHTATAFTFATMLHMEYGWRSPWFSIGAYTVAAATGVMRMANDRHWMTDVLAGALIGIGSVHLGYLVNDLIFKDKGLNKAFRKEPFHYDKEARVNDFDLIIARRFVLGSKDLKEAGKLPDRGSSLALSASLPIIPRAGVMFRLGAGSLENVNVYNALTGGCWNLPFASRGQFCAYLLAGYARLTAEDPDRADVVSGISLAWCPASSFKLKAFAEYEHLASTHGSYPIPSILLGVSSGFYF